MNLLLAVSKLIRDKLGAIIAKYFLEDKPVEETIMECTDIYDFCKTFNATHGWTCETANSSNVEGEEDWGIEQRQKTNRY